MDYNSKLEIAREVSMNPEDAKEIIREFMMSNDSLEGIQILQLEEFLNHV
ncbi:uncharacterized protein Eint_091675 [Encephalitozoon intestinalis ATCC 50506]|uniref:Uncharacterized protein n=1 Tax=Encephalitozoon intestinalis (strain ATCC 50506) TaxID=876142 RepID=W8Q214_ENCIT|nr:uncharacterized protein Eint_091675 [Encephalitozoon intestinalis ATCC 50506]AHL30154.1 hypothetical protein Eint_091675 [Encephalitozoon intestinalis ATCC 50506]UTX46106.1 hypothetical protein GPK93_09g16940 [Encephalitozoon intestinalis]